LPGQKALTRAVTERLKASVQPYGYMDTTNDYRQVAELAKIAERIHRELLRNDLDAVIGVLNQYAQKADFPLLEQYFLMHYQYNFKARFFQKADFNMCMKLSGVLNRRIAPEEV
jgi:hypothetical protein